MQFQSPFRFRIPEYLADPGEARGYFTFTPVINRVSHAFTLTALRRRHAQAVSNCSSSYKIDYVIVIKIFLNPKGHHNCITGSKVTAILVKG